MKEAVSAGCLISPVFQVGGEEIKAHRCVLARHSEVFSEFFTDPTVQKAADCVVTIQDFSPDSVSPSFCLERVPLTAPPFR
jgi:hypothetical protein